MKTPALLCAFAMCNFIQVFAQNKTSDLWPQCPGPIENEVIGMNCSTADTLNMDDLEICNSLTLNDLSGRKVDSYRLVYIAGQDMVLYEVTDNQIPDSFLNGFKLSGEKSLLAENVIGIERGNYSYLGHRWFHFH